MKSLLLILLSVFFPIKLYSQYTLEKSTNLPRSGDCILKQEVSYKSPNLKGAESIWDFSELSNINKGYELRYNSSRVDSDTIVGLEHSTIYYYQLVGDTLMLMSYENPTTYIRYSTPETLFVYPFPYGRSFTSYFVGKGNYCDRLAIDICGKTVITADAKGMLVIPGGDTLRHVLRVHTSKKIVENIKPESFSVKLNSEESLRINSKDSIEWHLEHDSTHLELDIWRWFVEGYRYPVFESINSVTCNLDKRLSHFAVSFYYPIDEQYYDLDYDSKNQERRDKSQKTNHLDKMSVDKISNHHYEDEIIQYRYTFDGKSVSVNYTLKFDGSIMIGIYDIQGRQLSAAERLSQPKGSYEQQLMFETLPRGEYLLRISVDNKVYGEKIISFGY